MYKDHGTAQKCILQSWQEGKTPPSMAFVAAEGTECVHVTTRLKKTKNAHS